MIAKCPPVDDRPARPRLVAARTLALSVVAALVTGTVVGQPADTAGTADTVGPEASSASSATPATEGDGELAGDESDEERRRRRAQEKFLEGSAAHGEGRHADAASLFESAHWLAPRGAALFNAAVSWEAAGDTSRAADDYEIALTMPDLTPTERSIAADRLAALRRLLGYLRVDEPTGGFVTVDRVKHRPIPVRVHLPPGDYEVRVEYEGQVRERGVVMNAGETFTLDVVMTAGPRVDPTPSATLAPTATVPPPPAAPRPSPWPWVAYGVGAVFTGFAVGFGVDTLAAQDQYLDSGRTDLDAYDRAGRSQAVTNVSLVGALVSVGVGTTLLLVDAKKRRRARASTAGE